MSTKILDGEGGFSFKRLPAGEYTLIANFSYDKEINVPEVVGQTHTFNAAGVHLGTRDNVVTGHTGHTSSNNQPPFKSK